MPDDENGRNGNGDSDKPMSSEDMLREFREDVEEFSDEALTPDEPSDFDDDDSPSAEHIAEALSSGSFGDDPGATRIQSPPEPTSDPSATRPVYSLPDAAPPPVLPPPPPGDIFARPGDDPYDPATRPATGDDRVGRSTAYPPPMQRSPAATRNRGWIIGAVLVALVTAGVAALFLVAEDSTPVEDLVVGDCLNDPPEELVFSVERVPCDEVHDYEVFALYREAPGPYPGDEAIFTRADGECITYFESYVGTPFQASEVWYTYFTPTREGWDEGDREVTCMLYLLDDSFEVVPTTGSLRNSGR